jgi:anthranilate synthase component 1
MRLSIGIRTMTVTRDRVYYHVGSGIVADSDPAREYEETLQKAEGMRQAIEACGKL